MKKIIATGLLVLFYLVSFGQNSVRYNVEPVIEKIQADYIKSWNKVEKTSGYRIQIMAFTGTNSRNTAEAERSRFSTLYPSIHAYISYSEPYFRLRVGNFRTRLEAYKKLTEVQLNYPGAYIISDKIDFFEN